jgi:hypothetical protein
VKEITRLHPHFQKTALPANSFVFIEGGNPPPGTADLGVIISFDAPFNPNGGPQNITNLWIFDEGWIKVPLTALSFPKSQQVTWWNNAGDAGISLYCNINYNNPDGPPNTPYVTGDIDSFPEPEGLAFTLRLFVYDLLKPYELESVMADGDGSIVGAWEPATTFTSFYFTF